MFHQKGKVVWGPYPEESTKRNCSPNLHKRVVFRKENKTFIVFSEISPHRSKDQVSDLQWKPESPEQEKHLSSQSHPQCLRAAVCPGSWAMSGGRGRRRRKQCCECILPFYLTVGYSAPGFYFIFFPLHFLFAIFIPLINGLLFFADLCMSIVYFNRSFHVPLAYPSPSFTFWGVVTYL